MTTDTAAEQAAIAAVPQKIVEAWAKHDATAFAEVFTDDGTLVLPGVYRKGYDDIRKFINEAFKTAYKGTRVTGTPIDMRRHGDMAVIVTKGGVLAAGDTEVSTAAAIHATWTVVREQGEWLLAAYHNSPVNVPEAT